MIPLGSKLNPAQADETDVLRIYGSGDRAGCLLVELNVTVLLKAIRDGAIPVTALSHVDRSVLKT